MNNKPDSDQDELSLLDVYTFIQDGWKTIAGFSALGLAAGAITAFALPEKFQASALIEPATVAVKSGESVTAKSVEPVAVLTEKMRSPTYYSDTTIQNCGLSKDANPPKKLVDMLKPNVARNSQYISVNYKAPSPAAAVTCLESVLKDVVNNQAQIAKPLINNMEVVLGNAEQELAASKTERDQQRIKNRERLNVAKAKLVAGQTFVEQFSKDSLQFKFDDPQFSASALLLSTLMNKQNEIKDLEIQINALELEVGANLTSKDQQVRSLINKVTEMKNALLAPATRSASFAAPVYAPDTKVEPKRSMVMVVGLIGGGLIGLLLLIVRVIRNKLRQPLQP